MITLLTITSIPALALLLLTYRDARRARGKRYGL